MCHGNERFSLCGLTGITRNGVFRSVLSKDAIFAVSMRDGNCTQVHLGIVDVSAGQT